MKRSIPGITAALFVVMFCGQARAAFFTMPFDGDLFLTPEGGSAGATSEFGLGSSQANFMPLFTNLPFSPTPNTELKAGTFAADTSVDFGIETQFGGTFFAFSNDTTSPGARTAFMDLDNSLGLGGNVVQSLGNNKYLLHLDDAASFEIDDDDDDILMQIRVAPASVPEPTAIALLAPAGALLMRRRRRGR